MRFVLLIGVALALALGFASRAAATTSVPPDVIGGLARESILVEGVAVSRLGGAVAADAAIRVVVPVLTAYAGLRPSAYLVRIVAHPRAFDPLPPGTGWSSISPLQVGDLAWLVVVRDARIPSLNPHHPRVLIETLVFLVRTDAPKWVAGMTIWP